MLVDIISEVCIKGPVDNAAICKEVAFHHPLLIYNAV